jgi:hypothetical protein
MTEFYKFIKLICLIKHNKLSKRRKSHIFSPRNLIESITASIDSKNKIRIYNVEICCNHLKTYENSHQNTCTIKNLLNHQEQEIEHLNNVHIMAAIETPDENIYLKKFHESQHCN